MMVARQRRLTVLLIVGLLVTLFLAGETASFCGHNSFSSPSQRRLPVCTDTRFATCAAATFPHDKKDPRVRSPSSSSSSSSSSALFQSFKPDDNAYSDDCFGLVFVVGGFLAKDVVFAGIFLATSAIAATLTNTGGKLLPPSRRVPGVVAGLTLALTLLVSNSNILLSSSISSMIGSAAADRNPDALMIEIALCSFSIIYAFLDPSLFERNKS